MAFGVLLQQIDALHNPNISARGNLIVVVSKPPEVKPFHQKHDFFETTNAQEKNATS